MQLMRPNHSEEFVFAELNSVNWTFTSKPRVRFWLRDAALSVSLQSFMYLILISSLQVIHLDFAYIKILYCHVFVDTYIVELVNVLSRTL